MRLLERFRVCDLGVLVQLSRSRFSKCFRISVGQSPYHYILSRRIDVARRAVFFFSFASAIWAMLPEVAREN